MTSASTPQIRLPVGSEPFQDYYLDFNAIGDELRSVSIIVVSRLVARILSPPPPKKAVRSTGANVIRENIEVTLPTCLCREVNRSFWVPVHMALPKYVGQAEGLSHHHPIDAIN